MTNAGVAADTELLVDLNPAQRAAVLSQAAPLCILAGAGSGKTRVLTRRIAHRISSGAADAPHTLAITFTRKAAGELRKRLTALGVRERVATGTFHAIAYAQLRQLWADTGKTPPQLTTSKIRLIVPLLARYGGRVGSVQPVDIASEIEWAKARLLPPSEYAAEIQRIGRKPPLGAEPMAELYRQYEQDKRRRGIMDFDDLLSVCVHALESDAAFAARQQWRFRHLFVDEFQDVNPAQHRLLLGWLADRTDLTVVGDPNQAIYAWNGADPRFLTEFSSRHPSASVIRLEDNYRSSPEILTAADAVLGFGPRDGKPLRPNRPGGPTPTVHAFPTDLEEARAVARAIRDRHSVRLPWSHFAVLMRTNAQALLLEEAFRAAGIPFRVRGSVAFLALAEIQGALSHLQQASALVPLQSRLHDLVEMAEEAAREGASGAEGTNERAANLEGLVRLANEYLAADPSGTAAGFVAWLRATITSPADEPSRSGAQRADVVEITTFHKAKGLEWPVVFLTGMERGFVPIAQADNEEAWNEERRLLYVAVTRAERELHCTWAESRTFGTRTTTRQPSPWLANVEAAITAARDPDGRDWRAILKATRDRANAAKAAGVPGIRGTKAERVQVGRAADPALLEALKEWRRQASRRSGVPAYVIMHDTTLAAIAEARPANVVQLVQVPGMGPVKADRYGQDILAVVGGRPAA